MQIHFVSQSLGILTAAFGWITSLVGAVLGVVIKVAVALVSNMLYMIGVQLFGLLDFVQMLFKRLSGLDTHWYNGVGREEDILLSLFQDPAIINSLIAMTIVAIAMLIIATIVQIIRVEYTTEGAKNTKGGIIGSSFKALAMFMIVPIGSFMGIFISNQLLRSVEAATNVGGSQYIAGAIFVASSTSANKVRYVQGDFSTGQYGDTFNNIMDTLSSIVTTIVMGSLPGWSAVAGPAGAGGAGAALGGTIAGWNLVNEDGSIKPEYNNGGMFTSGKSDPVEKRNEIAEKIDRAFSNKVEYNNSTVGEFGGYFDYNNVALVSLYYNISSMNFLLLIAGSIMAIYFLYMAAFGMIMRLFKATALFIIAPPVVALMPLDNGNAFKQWRTSFIGSIISAYGVVIALNIFFLIMPVLENIKIFDPSNWLNYANNALVYLLFVVVGLMSVTKISKIVSDIAGKGDDALSEGTAVGKKITGAAINTAAMAYGVGHAVKMGGEYASRATDKETEAKGFLNQALATDDKDEAEFLMSKYDEATKEAGQYSEDSAKYKARGKRIALETPEHMFKSAMKGLGGDIDKTLDSVEGPFRKKDKLDREIKDEVSKMRKSGKMPVDVSETSSGLLQQGKLAKDSISKKFGKQKIENQEYVKGLEDVEINTDSVDDMNEDIIKENNAKDKNAKAGKKLLKNRNKAFRDVDDAIENGNPAIGSLEANKDKLQDELVSVLSDLSQTIETLKDETIKASTRQNAKIAVEKVNAGQNLNRTETAALNKFFDAISKQSNSAKNYAKSAAGSGSDAATTVKVVGQLKADPNAKIDISELKIAAAHLEKLGKAIPLVIEKAIREGINNPKK